MIKDIIICSRGDQVAFLYDLCYLCKLHGLYKKTDVLGVIMKTVSAAELQRNIGRYQDIALREPVAVTRNGRESCVLLSTDEFKRLMRRDRRVVLSENLSEDEIAAIAASEMPQGYEHLDELLKDWKP